MATTRRTARGRRPRPRKKSSIGSVLAGFVALAAGGGAVYFMMELHKPQPAPRPKTANVPTSVRRTTSVASTTSTTVPKEIDKAAQALKKLEDSFDTMLEAEQYKEIVVVLDEVVSVNPSEEQLKAVEDYREKLGAHVKERFSEIKLKSEALVKENKLDEALSLVKEARDFGVAEISSEVTKQEAAIERLKTQMSFESQLAAYARLNGLISKPLDDYNYKAASVLVKREAASPRNLAFKDDLLGMLEDFGATEELWRQFLKKMEAKIGSVEMFGIDQGKIAAVRDGTFVMNVRDREKQFTLRDMQPKWIEIKMDLSGGSPPEQWYPVGLLYLHKGRWSDAKPIFERVGKLHDGVARQFRWKQWEREVAATGLVGEAKKAAAAKDYGQVADHIEEIRTEFGDTQVAIREKGSLAQLEKQAAAAVGQLKRGIGAKLKQFERIAAEAEKKVEALFEEGKVKVEEQYKADMTDSISYRQPTRSAYGGTSYSYPTGTFISSGDGYYVLRIATDKESNLKVVNSVLGTISNSRYSSADAQRKQLQGEKKRLEREISNARKRRKANADRLKLTMAKKRRDLRNDTLRTERKIKSGEDLSDAEMRRAVGL